MANGKPRHSGPPPPPPQYHQYLVLSDLIEAFKEAGVDHALRPVGRSQQVLAGFKSGQGLVAHTRPQHCLGSILKPMHAYALHIKERKKKRKEKKKKK